jgi:hypothetical protein
MRTLHVSVDRGRRWSVHKRSAPAARKLCGAFLFVNTTRTGDSEAAVAERKSGGALAFALLEGKKGFASGASTCADFAGNDFGYFQRGEMQVAARPRGDKGRKGTLWLCAAPKHLTAPSRCRTVQASALKVHA